jgi:hypothetical protein
MGLITGSKYFVMQIVGEAPPGMTDAEIHAALSQAVSVAAPMIPFVKQLGIAVKEGRLTEPPQQGSSKLAQ